MDNVWSGNEPVTVEARFLPNGEVRPSAFTWRGRSWTVAGLGRQWNEADGRHILVGSTDGSRFELCLTSAENTWRLLRSWERPNLA